MNRYTNLAKNSVLFALANLGSHLISFLLVRFYTEFLSSKQYGIIDFLISTSSLVVPIISISIVEAVLRFSIDEKNKNEVLCNGLYISAIGSVAFAFVGFFIFGFTTYIQYYWYFFFIVLFTNLGRVFANFVRGIKKVSIFAISGVIKTFALVGSNLFLILVLKMRIEGYLLSVIFSEVVTIIYIIIAGKIFSKFIFRINNNLMKQMIKYSVPLLPNSLSWWIMNAADKYVIIAFLGDAANGIYAVAHKLPTLINLCNSLFFQAWQLSAVEEADSKTKSEFYSTVFNLLSFSLFALSGILLLLLKPIMSVLVAEEYNNAWEYAPFLILSMVFAAFSSFLGTNYVAMKKTKGALKTTFVGSIVNIVLNIILINFIGMNGPALATMISFGVTWIYRIFDTKSFVRINYRIGVLTVSTFLLIVQSIFLILGFEFCYISGMIIFLIICIIYFKELKTLINKSFQIIYSKFHR